MEEKSELGLDLFAVRSVLFLPASNPRAIEKARQAGSDLVVLDLEDAVKPAEKDKARDRAVDAVATPWPMPVGIRINSAGSEYHFSDLDAAGQSKADFVVVSRVDAARTMSAIAEAVRKPVIAMIETAAGVLAAPEIAAASAGLIAGTNDLRADLHLPLDSSRAPISASLQLIVLAARARGVAVFDGVFNRLGDPEGFLAEAEEGRSLGFDGKSLIHPSQIEPCHQAFAPNEREIERAKALVDAFRGGAERFGDEMIERMHIEAARRILARNGL